MRERHRVDRVGPGNERRLRDDEVEVFAGDGIEQAARRASRRSTPFNAALKPRERKRALVDVGADDIAPARGGNDRERTGPGRDIEDSPGELERERGADLLRRRSGRDDGVGARVGPIAGDVRAQERHQPTRRHYVVAPRNDETRGDDRAAPRRRRRPPPAPRARTGVSNMKHAISVAAESLRAARA